MRTVSAAVSALSLGVVLLGVAHAEESKREAGIADFVDVCPAALLTPGGLPAALKARGLSKKVTGNPGVRIGATLYASADGRRIVTLAHYQFSDLSMASCTVSLLEALSTDDLADLRTRLEGHASVASLEGELIEATRGLRTGILKRPGNAPIVTINITTTKKLTTLTMNSWDLMPGK
jgi:hypothetical protein